MFYFKKIGQFNFLSLELQICSGSSSAERAFSGGVWNLSGRPNHRVINLERHPAVQSAACHLRPKNLCCQTWQSGLRATVCLAVQSCVLQPCDLCLLGRSVTCFSGEPQSSTLFAKHFILDSCYPCWLSWRLTSKSRIWWTTF